MFFKKSKNPDEAVAKKGIKKMDAIVTGAILGGVVASLYGVKKIREQKNETLNNESTNTPKKKKSNFLNFFFKK